MNELARLILAGCTQSKQSTSRSWYSCLNLLLIILFLFLPGDACDGGYYDYYLFLHLFLQIPTNQTPHIWSKNSFMRKMLAHIRDKIDSGSYDITIEYTLSELWSLTGRSY